MKGSRRRDQSVGTGWHGTTPATSGLKNANASALREVAIKRERSFDTEALNHDEACRISVKEPLVAVAPEDRFGVHLVVRRYTNAINAGCVDPVEDAYRQAVTQSSTDESVRLVDEKIRDNKPAPRDDQPLLNQRGLLLMIVVGVGKSELGTGIGEYASRIQITVRYQRFWATPQSARNRSARSDTLDRRPDRPMLTISQIGSVADVRLVLRRSRFGPAGETRARAAPPALSTTVPPECRTSCASSSSAGFWLTSISESLRIMFIRPNRQRVRVDRPCAQEAAPPSAGSGPA